MWADPPPAARGTPGRRDRILDALRASPRPLGIPALAEQLGVHANTVRFHLEILLRAGRVEQVAGRPAGRGRPPVLFRMSHRMDPAGPTNYRLLAGMLLGFLSESSPDPVAAAAELGRAWGPRVLAPTGAGHPDPESVPPGEAVDRLTRALTDIGFAPAPLRGPDDDAIRLHHCPFLDVVTGADPVVDGGRGRVVCALHLGLMQGALASSRAPVTVDRLDPFVEPDLCVAHLTPAGER